MTDPTRSDDGSDYRIGRRRLLELASVTGLAALFSGTGAAARPDADDSEVIEAASPPPTDPPAGVPDDWVRDVWFVEFDSRPSAFGGQSGNHDDERSRLRRECRREGVQFDERHDFSTLWNGLSVRAGLAEAVSMSGLDGVAGVYPVAVFDRPEPEAVSPELETALAMTGADAAQSELGFSGQGLSVGVVDTGVDYNHPDLGGSGDPDVVLRADFHDRGLDHPRITHGWDYVGDEFDANDPDAVPRPNPNPMDSDGHGTHVTGIVGADAADPQEGAVGVAPDVEFGAYKVFGAGSTTADVIVQAMEDAYRDGMDVVNLSLGATLMWGQEYPTTAVANELVEEGVYVVVSAGNDAALGAWTLSAPADATDAISVASVENTHVDALAFEVDQLEDPVPYLVLEGAEAPPTGGESAPLALPATSEIDGEEGYFGCEPADFEDFPEGSVALIERGHCAFAQKYQNAVEAGATGVVVFNNVPGLFSGTIQDAGVEGVWGVGVDDASGAALVDLLESGETVTLTFTDDQLSVPNPNAGLLSDFSSYGQAVELGFDPSVAAPGGLITSTYPLEQDGYAMLGGTSMAAPHVAGAVALLVEADPDLDPLDARQRLQNTAEPAPWSLAPDAGFLDHSFRQGAGLIQVDSALETQQRARPGQIAAGEGTGTSATVTLENDGQADVEYAIEHVGTVGTAINTFAPTFLTPGSAIDAPETVTVPAGGSAEVDVTISAPEAGVVNHQYGGYVLFTPDDEALDQLVVPYAGYDGDYQELDLFGYYTGPDEFVEQEPRLSEIVEREDGEPSSFEPVEPGHEFEIAEDDLPVVEAFFGHFPQELRVYAVHAESGREWLVLEEERLPRSPDPDSFYSFVWDGTVRAGWSPHDRPVASGTYTLRVEALRTLGDPENPEHVDTWESPEFELDARRHRRRQRWPAPPGVPGHGRGGAGGHPGNGSAGHVWNGSEGDWDFGDGHGWGGDDAGGDGADGGPDGDGSDDGDDRGWGSDGSGWGSGGRRGDP